MSNPKDFYNFQQFIKSEASRKAALSRKKKALRDPNIKMSKLMEKTGVGFKNMTLREFLTIAVPAVIEADNT